MKKTLVALTCGFALALSAGTAQALTIGDADPNYLGHIIPGTPSSESDEAEYINYLIGMDPSEVLTDPPTDLPGNNTTFARSDNTCGVELECPLVTDPTTFFAGGANTSSANVTGWEWLYVKYGGDAHVWYVGDLSGVQPFPLSDGQNNSSHYTLFNGTTTTVPDGGATLGLLGLGMLGLGYLRRRRQQ